MIDYMKIKVRISHNLIGKEFVTMTSMDSMNIDYEPVQYATRKRIHGSDDSSISIRTKNPDEQTLEIEGNFTKFLQGHNLFGINDVNRLVNLTIEALCNHVDVKDCLQPTESELKDIKQGAYHITRIDLNENYHLQDIQDVRKWLSLAENKMSLAGVGKVSIFYTTLYFGKGSRTKEVKLYSKGDEVIANHSLPERHQILEMKDYANKMLRFELRLNSKWLRHNKMNSGKNWTEEKVNEVIDSHRQSIRIFGNMPLSDKTIMQLKPHLISTYFMWKDGYDMKEKLHPSTFLRHRQELFKHGIDISTVMPKFENVTMPMKDVFNNVADIPEWAYEKRLVAL